jgi:cell division protein FtsI/penicillin-binding protein 2
MIPLREEGYGQPRHIPQLVLAGASVDDVFVIVVFTALTGFLSSGTADVLQVAGVPVSIALGVLLGIAVGAAMLRVFRAFATSDPVKVLILLSISFLLLETEDRLEGILPVSGLLAIMSMGMLLRRKEEPLARRLSAIYNKLWLAAEVFLFVLVGAAVDLKYAAAAGLAAAALVAGAMVWRMGGVALSVAGTALTRKERLFCMVAYTPKATVQAAIGQSDNKATPLQLCAYLSAIVNGGNRYSAHLLDRVCEFGIAAPIYSDEAHTELLSSLDISEEDYSTIMEGLKQMVSDSSAIRRYLADNNVDYRAVGGKTGTAQIERSLTDEETGEKVKYELTNGLFIGTYAPNDTPELVVSVVIENAAHGYFAGMTAASIFGAWEQINGD